jgi:O-antigen ligase
MNTPSPRMEYIVQDVLKKDMTFSFRTHIWEQTKLLIEREPLLGYGEHDDQWYQTELDGLTTHNLVLHILLKGGWVAMSCFILLVIATHIQVLRYRLRTTSYAPYMLMAGLWVYLFMMIFEVYPFYSLSIIFIYASLFSRSWNVPADHILNLSK